MAINTYGWGWAGLRSSLSGAALGLVLLLPFVLLRSLGAGDWKMAGAAGAFAGVQPLLTILLVTILVAGAMAAVTIIQKKRVRESIRNIGRILGALLTLHLPAPDLSLDNPSSLKVPFGVAMALAVILFAGSQLWATR